MPTFFGDALTNMLLKNSRPMPPNNPAVIAIVQFVAEKEPKSFNANGVVTASAVRQNITAAILPRKPLLFIKIGQKPKNIPAIAVLRY